MASRKSLDAALELSPEKLAFIRGTPNPPPGEQAAQPESLELQSPEPSATENLTRPAVGDLPVWRSRKGKPLGHLFSPEDDSIVWVSNLLVPLTTRLQPATAAALKRAGVEQKLRGQSPGTVQEIAEAALQLWLRENGFLA